MEAPEVWGPILWRAVHLVALGYPDDPSATDVANYKQFFGAFGSVLPCPKCAYNYARHLQELPIDDFLTGGHRRLFEWSVHLHNIVNAEKGKPIMSVDSAYAMLLSASPPSTLDTRRTCPIEDPTEFGANIPAVMALMTVAAVAGVLITIYFMRRSSVLSRR